MNRVIVGYIKLEDIPGHPELQKGTIDGHTVVVGRHYDQDTLGFFIPEDAIVPDHLLEDMWLKGKLAGKQKNRVKIREMAGIKSDGLFYGSCYWKRDEADKQFIEVYSRSWKDHWKAGDDITDELGITFREKVSEGQG